MIKSKKSRSILHLFIFQVVVTAVSPRLTVLGVVVPSLPKAAENEARTVGRPTTLLRARISTEDPEGIIEATTARPEALPQTWGETYQANLVSPNMNMT